MTRTAAGVILGVALAAGAALRGAHLDERPMHHDEANQAVKFGALLEHGDYRYDYRDHHGPTLYYLTLPSAWLDGRHTLAAVDEATLRRVPAFFGVTTILLLPLLSAGIGRTATTAAALLMAISPAMVFYSRMFIQEALFTCFTLGFVIAVGRIATSGGRAAWMAAGVAAGLAIATKETSIIVLPAAAVACLLAWWSTEGFAHASAKRQWRTHALVAVALAIGVAATFYSSFFTAPAGILEPLRGAPTYLARGVDPANHAHSWWYYVQLLAYSSSGGVRWSEGLVLLLAIVGAACEWRTFWARYLACDVAIAGAVFSALPYKTPWNVLPVYAVVFALAGCGFAALLAAARSRGPRLALVAVLLLASAQLAMQGWRAAVTYAADPRNPYAYAQTVPDAVRMAARIRDLAALDAHGQSMQVSVIASPYEQWPLPWYLRMLAHVGYWTSPGDPIALQAPVIVSSMEFAASLEAALGDRYVEAYYGLRPDVVQALFVERGLWDRFLAGAK